jgi:ABC-type multidrug transport system ATPase subunit
LLQVQDNWFGSLSGGQRAKADFIRSVFLRPACPSLLLVDEGFAALDPASKALVHAKLKAFCQHSLVLCIYHTDSAASMGSSNATTAESSLASSNSITSTSNGTKSEGSSRNEGSGEGSELVEEAGVESGKGGESSGQAHGCLANSGFFDANLHFKAGTVQLRPLCGNSN